VARRRAYPSLFLRRGKTKKERNSSRKGENGKKKAFGANARRKRPREVRAGERILINAPSKKHRKLLGFPKHDAQNP